MGFPSLSLSKKIAEALDAKLVIKIEPKGHIGKYMLASESEKPLTIGEARKRYGRHSQK